MKLNFLDCWKRRKDLPAFESGELPPERAEALAAHLAICDRCRTEWEALAGVAEALRAAPPEPVVPALNLWSRIEAEILEPVPATPPPSTARWKVAALPVGAALAGAAVFAATGGLSVFTPKAPKIADKKTSEVATQTSQTLEAGTPVAPVVAIANKVVSTPEPTPEPIEVDPTPAPTPKAVRPKPRRAIAAPRKDPFAPSEKIRKATPGPDYWNNDDEIVEDTTVIAASPPIAEPDVKTVQDSKHLEPEPDAVIRVNRPIPTRSARRDIAADAEAAERRAADALGSPLDAVARASQPRKLFP